MKSIKYAVLSMFLLSCGSIHDKPNEIDVDGYTYSIIIIDGCEYLVKDYVMSHKASIAHKGNCRQCIERQKAICKNPHL